MHLVGELWTAMCCGFDVLCHINLCWIRMIRNFSEGEVGTKQGSVVAIGTIFGSRAAFPKLGPKLDPPRDIALFATSC
jgi:hypothetical protein